MDYESDDWNDFVDETGFCDLKEKKWFSTDFGNYPLIYFGIRNVNDLKPSDVIRGNVDAVYERKRGKILVTHNVNETILMKINKIVSIYNYSHNMPFTKIDIPPSSIVIIGDNWFIIFNHEKILNSYVLENDIYAKEEYTSIYMVLSSMLPTLSNIDTEQLSKVLRKKGYI